MKYNPQIHHRRSIRLKEFDYSQAGVYFITICCENRQCRFGEIENMKMVLNDYGVIAHNEWLKTPELRPNVELGEFVIMPNHMHGIIRLLGRGELHSPNIENKIQIPDKPGQLKSSGNPGESTNESMGQYMGECNSPLRSPSQTIGAIVRGYKSSVTKQLRLLGFNQILWQRNYHEHIIRNDQSYQTISDYIINNPAKWNDDNFFMQK